MAATNYNYLYNNNNNNVNSSMMVPPTSAYSNGYGYDYGYPFASSSAAAKYASIFANNDSASAGARYPSAPIVSPIAHATASSPYFYGPSYSPYYSSPVEYQRALFERAASLGCPWALSSLSSAYCNAAPYYNNNKAAFGNNNLYNGGLYNVSFRPSSAVELYSLTNPIRVLDREGNRMLWLCYDLKGYKPEEVCVTLNKAERAIIVEAAHEAKEGKEHHVMRKFYRKFILPETLAKVDLSKVEVKSSLNAEGLLTIECSGQSMKMTTEEIAKCPTMSKAVYSPYGYNYSGYYGCPSTFNVSPINCKIN